MNIVDFKNHHNLTKQLLKTYLDNYFCEHSLILNDTRLVIEPSVLVDIEFINGYEQRIYSILKNSHIVFTNPHYPKIKEYFQSLWLSTNVKDIIFENESDKTLTDIILNDPQKIAHLKKLNLKKLIPFFVNERVEKLAKTLNLTLENNLKTVQNANNKIKLKEFLLQAQLPTLNWVITNNTTKIKTYFNQPEKYVFKMPLGVSGYWFWNNKDNKINEILDNFNNNELIIEQFIEKEASPSLQFFIPENKEKTIIIFWFTDQILENGQYYLGNSSPSIYLGEKEIYNKIIKQSKLILERLKEIGYSGFGWIDFIIDQKKEVFATEINARFTGATFPTITAFLLQKSLHHQWEYTSQDFEIGTNINYFISENSIQKPHHSGIFPLCISPLEKHGKTQILKLK